MAASTTQPVVSDVPDIETLSSAEITKNSGSNLALSFACLPPEKRRAMCIFYAFCRVIDDIADSELLPIADKRERLAEWHEEIRRAYQGEPCSPLGVELSEIIRTYLIPPTPLQEIIKGVEMDLTIDRYETFAELEAYCYRVASAVGLVSIEIFCYQQERTRDYAVALGMAFQLTNILRDVRKDAGYGRIYLPRQEMAHFGVTEDDIMQGRWSEKMRQLCRFQGLRARHYYAKSWRLLPAVDRANMVAAEIMREVYEGVLHKIERHDYDVFSEERRLNKAQKAWKLYTARRREKRADPPPPPPKRVIVLGAGFAGLAAATELTLRGHEVSVLESRRLLGGRAHSFPDAKSGEVVDNGQHILMGCYHESLALIRQLGCGKRLLRPDSLRVPYLSARGASVLKAANLPAPLHLGAALLGFTELSLSDRWAAARLCTRLQLGQGPTDGETVTEWLARWGQTQNVIRAVWEPLCLAALNEAPSTATATLFATVISRGLLGGKEDSKIIISRVGLSDLFAPEAETLLEMCGGKMERSAVVTKLEIKDSEVVAVETQSGQRVKADHFVSTLPWNALAKLLPVGAPLATQCRELEESPIVSLHLWLDREIMDEPFVGFLDSPLHWVFSHDHIAADATRADRPEHLRGAHRYALVVSGAGDMINMPTEEIEALGLREMRRFLGRSKDAEVLHRVVYKSRGATFKTTPDAEKVRPGTSTGWHNLWLAGDWTDTGLPATLEGAIVSGNRAAHLVDAAAIVE